MKIIRKYILKECIVPFFLSLMILTCIFLLGNLVQLANMVINKGVAIETVGKVFLLYIPVLLGYTLPIACLISVIIGFSRLSADNEILALRACGIHVSRLLIPFIAIGLIMSLACIILNERVIPYAHHQQRMMLKNLGVKNPTALLESGMFIHAFEGQILFIHKIQDNNLYNITIYQPQPDGPTRTIIARRGEFTPVPGKDQIKLKLIDGTADEPNLEKADSFFKLNFDTYFMTLDLSKEKKEYSKKPKSMTLKELKSEITRLEVLLVDTSRFETEYLRKITWSFSPFVFILLGFPIAVITNRREKSANIVLAIFCGVTYYMLSLGCEALSIEQIVKPWILWTPNIVGLIVATYLNIKCAS